MELLVVFAVVSVGVVAWFFLAGSGHHGASSAMDSCLVMLMIYGLVVLLVLFVALPLSALIGVAWTGLTA